MPFFTPTASAIRDALLRDIKNQLPDANISSDSDYFIRASSVASIAEGIYQHQCWIVRQIFPDTADTEYLELHCRTRGITRKPSTKATGPITLTGDVGSYADSGLVIKRDDKSYITTEPVTIGSNGQVVVAGLALADGTAGNTAVAQAGMLTTTPDGFDSAVTIGVMSGGTEKESDTELLTRLLELIRRPPAGGNRHDYKRWALEVPGVSAAYVYPLRRGLGTVDVVITSANNLPSSEIIKNTQAHIDDVRPVTAKNTLVLAPTIKEFELDIKARLEGISLQDATTQINAALTDYINRLNPGETFIRSQAEMLISIIAGVTDRQIVSPTGNVVPVADDKKVEWLRCSVIRVSLL
ncbi:baseplate J/gp47 family protein [Shigella sonnei]|nr:phage tail protein [Escherichia coli]EFW5532230.1 baseplate J/gp47 family protein [Shigella sonnei]EGA6848534.1 baseplate J/gp47 family protein [Shigella sonnei]